MSKPQQRSCNTRMTSRSSLQNTGKAKEVSGVSTGGLTDTPACCPRWGATTAGAARHPEQTVVRLLLLARLYVALQHCPLGQIFIPAGGLCPGVTVGEWPFAPVATGGESRRQTTTFRCDAV